MLAPSTRIPTQSRYFALFGLALLAAFVFSALAAVPASAHSTLLSASPEDGSELSEPPEAVVLTFNEDITDLGSDIVVTGPDGDDATSDETAIDGTEVSRPLADDLPAGEYTITWRVVSADGHPISGEFTFTLTEAAAGSGATDADSEDQDAGNDATADQTATNPPTEDAPSGDTASADSSGADDAGTSDSDDEGTSAGEIALFVVIALVVIGIIVTLLLRMRRQQ